MGSRAAILASAASLLVLAASARSAAEPPPVPSGSAGEARGREAEALRAQAEAHAAEGRPEEAITALRAAWTRSRDARAAARLGELLLQQGDMAGAATYLTFAVRAAPPGEPPEATAALKERLAEAARHVGTLDVRASAIFAEVWIDGARAGLAREGPFYAAPGPHAVEVRAPGYVPRRHAVEARAGEAHALAVTLARAAPAGPAGASVAARPAEPPAARSTKSAGTIAAGLSAAVMLGLLGGGFVSFGEQEMRAVGVGTLIVAGVAGAATLAYVLWPEPAPEPAPTARVRVLPAAGGGVAVLGSF